MRIQSKKTGLIQDISNGEWIQMTHRGEHRFFTVIDDSDNHLNTESIKVEPIAIDDDLAEGEQAKNDFEDEDEEKQFYKDALDEMDVKYHWNAKTETLKKLYEESL